METRQWPARLFFLLLVMTLSSGCEMFSTVQAPAATATNAPAPPYESTAKNERTATLQRVQDDYYQAELQAQATADASRELALSPEQDLPQAYEAFWLSASRMMDRGEALVIHADGLRFDGPAYLVESRKSVTECPLPGQERSLNQRQVELGGYFDAIADDAWEVKRAYRAYQFDLEQMVYFFRENLSPAAVSIIDPLVHKAQFDSERLIDALERAQGGIDAAKAATAAARPPGG